VLKGSTKCLASFARGQCERLFLSASVIAALPGPALTTNRGHDEHWRPPDDASNDPLPGSDCPRPWPSIEPLATSLAEVGEALKAKVEAWVTEKLDGSNLSVSARGLVCSRRKVLARGLALDDVKFSGLPLSPLRPLLPAATRLRNELVWCPDCSNVTVFGEFLPAGTATSKEDRFDYKRRGFKVGGFYAFGLALDVQNAEATREKARQQGYLATTNKNNVVYLKSNQKLQDLLTKMGFDCVQGRSMPLKDAFLAFSETLTRKDTCEGVVINVGLKSAVWKWKGRDETFSSSRLMAFKEGIAALTQRWPGVAAAIRKASQASPTFNQAQELAEALETAYISARTKFPLISDEEGRDKPSVLADYAKKIGQEMLVDAENVPGFNKKSAIDFAREMARKELIAF